MSTLISDAKLHEQNGKYAEALERWETLRSIQPAHPNLESDIERVTRLGREQPPREVAPPPPPPPPAAPVAPPRDAVKKTPPVRPPSAKRPWLWILLAGAAAISIGLVAFFFGTPAEPVPRAVAVRTTPPGALVHVDSAYRGAGDLELQLEPGSHIIEASLAGYLPARAELVVEQGAPASIDLILNPLPASLRVIADLSRARVTLDGEPLETAEENEFALDNLAAGDHLLSVKGRYGNVAVPFSVSPGAAPTVTGELEGKEVVAVAVAQFANSATVYCNCAPVPLIVDGAPAGRLEPEGLRLDSLPPGFHELTLGEKTSARQVALDTTAAPGLYLFVHTDRNVGALAVVAGEEDGATVTLNGKPYHRVTKSGRVSIYALPAASYRVGVRKDGFEAVDEQTVQVVKGRVATVRFPMNPVPVKIERSQLVIRDALAGASISIDGKASGTISYDGAFTASLSPGEHSVTISRDAFKPRTVERSFAPGETVRLGIEDVALEQILGELRVSLETADARVTIRRAGESPDRARPLTQTTARLVPGDYTVEATAPERDPLSKTLTIVPGETTHLPILLTARPVEKLFGMELWEDAASWSRQGAWYVRRGGDFIPYGASPVEGVIEFTARLERGRRLRWFVNLVDSKNYALFEIDGGSFYRNEVTKGKSKEIAKVAHARVADNVFNVRIQVKENAVVHQLRRNGEWTTIDTWTVSGRDFRRGKFGFYVRGRSQMGLSGFAYRPN